MPCSTNIFSVTRRLVLAARVYHIWIDRNRRLFSSEQRNWMDLVKVITNEIRFKLSSLKVIHSVQVSKVADRWQVKMNMQIGNEEMIDKSCSAYSLNHGMGSEGVWDKHPNTRKMEMAG